MYDNLYLHGFEDSEAVSALWLLFFLCCISAHVCVVSRPFRWAVGRWLRVQCSVIDLLALPALCAVLNSFYFERDNWQEVPVVSVQPAS